MTLRLPFILRQHALKNPYGRTIQEQTQGKGVVKKSIARANDI
jgi:hypothetical protein